MKIKQKDVVSANLRYANQWAPRASGDSDDIFGQKVAQRITVNPDDQEQNYIEVTFDTAMVWMIADKTPDANDILTFLSILVPVGVSAVAAPSPTSIALNSQNVLSGAADLTANVITSQRKAYFAKFVVPGMTGRPENWQLTATVLGSLLTTDTDQDEHACLPSMWAELMSKSSGKKSRFNVGLNDLVLVNQSLGVECVQINGPMISSTRIRGFLSTDGGVISRTVSAAMINEVRFQYSVCELEETGISIEEEPEEEVPEENPEEEGSSSEGTSGSGAVGGTGSHIASPGPLHH